MTRHSTGVVGAVIPQGGLGVGVWVFGAPFLPNSKSPTEISVGYIITGTIGVYGAAFSVGLFAVGGLYLAQYVMPGQTYIAAGVLTFGTQHAHQYAPRSFRMGGIAGGTFISAAGAPLLAVRADNAAANAAAPTIYYDLHYQD